MAPLPGPALLTASGEGERGPLGHAHICAHVRHAAAAHTCSQAHKHMCMSEQGAVTNKVVGRCR